MQSCPVCQIETKPNPRYPNYICRDCLAGGVLVGGAQVPLSELDVYSTDFVECEVAGVPCRAREAHLGGIVVQPI